MKSVVYCRSEIDVDDAGIPVQHIPPTVLKQVALHLDTGTTNTWESLAESMDLDAATVTVRFSIV